jgi:hypothetical protein
LGILGRKVTKKNEHTQVISQLFAKKIDFIYLVRGDEERRTGDYSRTSSTSRTSEARRRENEEKMRDDLHVPQFFITFVG